tara:strand:+ start:1692 stop:1967 length:276 start_codon:yes stop_codon:yes gene_type:complete
MGFFGSLIGNELGKLIGGKKHSGLGATLGTIAGDFLPFETGGAVKVKKGRKTQKAILHKNEYVLPANAPPTKKQKAIVAKNKRDAKKKGKK